MGEYGFNVSKDKCTIIFPSYRGCVFFDPEVGLDYTLQDLVVSTGFEEILWRKAVYPIGLEV